MITTRWTLPVHRSMVGSRWFGRERSRAFFAAAAVAALASFPLTASAFFEWSEGEQALELLGNLRVNQVAGYEADLAGLNEDRGLDVTNAVLRGIAFVTLADRWTLEVHGTQTLQGGLPDLALATLVGTADGFTASDFNRWAGLSWRWYDRGPTLAELAVDRLNVAFAAGQVEVKVGRQPVNFATTYYFTPNDFLQPFAAQTFFRVYKAGVDAARIDIGVGDVTQITLVGALGYEREASEPTLSDAITWDESAVILRASTSFDSVEFALLGGKAPRQYFAGGAVQGELFEWLGVRLEAHYAYGVFDGPRRHRARVAAGVEHRFESSLHVKLEYFYNGGGTTNTEEYLDVFQDPLLPIGAPYLGRHYLAAGVGYELHPLVTGEAFGLFNLTDGSGQGAAYVTYSMLDDVDLAAVISVPFGASPRLQGPFAIRLPSEFGSYPIAGSVEVRLFF